jgi:signal transduction histidine kinase
MALPPRHALLVGAVFSLAYLVIGQFIGPPVLAVGSQTTVETLATHLVLPVLVSLGVAEVADALRRLREQRLRAERLAIEAERRRIGWELHDSAKARVHAAHLVLSALRDAPPARLQSGVDQAIGELVAASADMDTSLAELVSPLDGRPLDDALRDRVRELELETDGPRFSLRGSTGELDPLAAAHAYRIATEAVLNAARHSGASRVQVALSRDGDQAHIVVADNGRGLPADGRPASNGLRAMRSRASTIGAALDISPGPDGRGTVVALHVPISPQGAPA